MAISTIDSTGLSASGIAQSNMGGNVAGTGPAFATTSNQSQSISSGTNTKVLFGNEIFDTNNNFASSRFTPTVAGYYWVGAAIYGAYSGSTESICLLYKNGTGYQYLGDTINATSRQVGGSTLVYMNGSTDYLEIYAYFSNAVTITADGVINYFNGFLMRAA